MMIASNPQLLAHMERFHRENKSNLESDHNKKGHEVDATETNGTDGVYEIKQHKQPELTDADTNEKSPSFSNLYFFPFRFTNFIDINFIATIQQGFKSLFIRTRVCACRIYDGTWHSFNDSIVPMTREKIDHNEISTRYATTNVPIAIIVGYMMGIISTKLWTISSKIVTSYNAASNNIIPFILFSLIVTVIISGRKSRLLASLVNPFSALFEERQKRIRLPNVSDNNLVDFSMSKQKTTALVLKECRHRIQSALGSIHAKPMIPPDTINNITTHIDDMISEQLQSYKSYSESLCFYVEANTRLLHTYDLAISPIEIASSMHLGLGPYSRSVSRVEDSMVGRHARRMRDGSNGVGSIGVTKPVLGVNRARELLFGSMRDQGDSILTFLQMLVDNRLVIAGDDSGANNTCVGDSKNGERNVATTCFLSRSKEIIFIKPRYLTVSFLKAYRCHLGELISHTASVAWKLYSQLGNLDAEGKLLAMMTMTLHLNRDVCKLDERQTHVESCFPQLHQNVPPSPSPLSAATDEHIQTQTNVTVENCEPHDHDNENKKFAGSETVREMISRLLSHTETTIVALWALEQSIDADACFNSKLRADSQGGEEQREIDKEMRSTKQDCHDNIELTSTSYIWWKRLSHHIGMIVNLHRTIGEQNFFPPNTEEIEKNNEHEADINTDNCELSTNEYEFECQIDVHDIEQYAQASKVAKKHPMSTIVYSAHGTMTKNNRLQNNTSSTNKRNEPNHKNSVKRPPPSMYHDSINGRMDLLKELQSRLEVIRMIDEEYEPRENDDSDKKGDKKMEVDKQGDYLFSAVRKKSSECKDFENGSKKVAPLFLGASGPLLSELRNALPQSALE